MPTYQKSELEKNDDKRGGKNSSVVDGYYHDADGVLYFIKQPQASMELFTELFAGRLLQAFKDKGLIEDKFHSSLICADYIQMENGYALIQPKVEFTELYQIIGTGYDDKSDRNPVLEMFFGPEYYARLAQQGYYYGLATCLMFSLFLGDYSVHSANVVRLDFPQQAASSSQDLLPAAQYARIDLGAAFRNFAHPDNNIDMHRPVEYRWSYKALTKGYLANYKHVPGLYASIVHAAALFKHKINQSMLVDIIEDVLKNIPRDLLDQATKNALAAYMFMPAFAAVSFGKDGNVTEVATLFATIFMQRLDCMHTLTDQITDVSRLSDQVEEPDFDQYDLDDNLLKKLSHAARFDPVFRGMLAPDLSATVLQDLLALKAFCDSKRPLNNSKEYSDSLANFYWDALRIRVSDKTLAAQHVALEQAAKRHFQHRNALPLRLCADALLLVSSVLGIGIYLGHKRLEEGKSFFFSSASTERERAFIEHCLNTQPEENSDTNLIKPNI